MQFATCCFKEYRDDMGGLPVRTANGAPKHRLKFAPHHGQLLPTLPLTFPRWPLVQAARKGLPWEKFRESYLEGLEKVGIDQILTSAEGILAQHEQWTRMLGREITPDTPIVLLCYERLSDGPDEFCHRTALREWLSGHLNQAIPELGSMWAPETAGDQAQQEQQDSLF